MNIGSFKLVLEHPVVKRLAVAVPISVGIGLIRAWIGEHSMLIGLPVGVGAYIFADWLFSTKAERQVRIRQTIVFLRENWMTVTKWAMYALMCSYFFGSQAEPLETAVKQVVSLVRTFGIIAVFIVPTITFTIGKATCGSWSLAAGLFSRFLKGLALYSMALWLLGQNGDALYKWVLAYPKDAAIGASSLTIVWMIVCFSSRSTYGSESIARLPAMAAMAPVFVESESTARDKRYTAAHEAGHTLVCAALGALPPDVKLVANDRPDHNGVHGFLAGIKSEHRLEEKTFAEWHMLVFLAGKTGEARIMGESTIGSTNDHARWVNMARQYLSNHYRGMFYPEPQNEFEQKLNEEKLSALQTEQLAMLNRLFELNSDVFKELAEVLLEKRTLARDEIIPFLGRVQLPEGFPLPFGPFKTFSAEYHVAAFDKWKQT